MPTDQPARLTDLEALAIETAHERSDLRVAAARLEGRVNSHEDHLRGINGSIGRLETDVRGIAKAVAAIEAAQSQRDAVAQALEQAVRESSQAQVTTRSYFVGLGLFLVALATLLLSVHL